MKFVKLSIFALAMGLCVASCGGSTEEETPAADTTATMETEIEATPVDTVAVPVDTTVVDTVAAPAEM